jgi:hypothetical protein
MINRTAGARSLRSIHDRAISGASAEIPRERILDFAPGRRGGLLIQSEHRHDEPGRTEPALAPVMFHHRFLHGMERPGRGPEIFHSDELLPVNHGEEHEAGVDRPVTESAAPCRLGYRDRARAAITFRATFFHASAGRE